MPPAGVEHTRVGEKDVFKMEQQTDTALAFRLMLQHVGDRRISECFFDTTGPPFNGIARTTWTDLEESNCVKPVLGSQHYGFTGRGWLRALQETGAARDRRFLRSAKVLLASIQKSVKGKQANARMMSIQTLAEHSGLSANWIYNAIESNLIAAHFNKQGPAWVHGFEGTAIHVPMTFGLEL
jgi:hypothetical protein